MQWTAKLYERDDGYSTWWAVYFVAEDGSSTIWHRLRDVGDSTNPLRSLLKNVLEIARRYNYMPIHAKIIRGMI
jgi:hypothetical protein